jgi:hypothetical protein
MELKNDTLATELLIEQIIKNYPVDQQKEIIEYLQQLNNEKLKTCFIAFDHLKSSFNIIKSNGFQEWKKIKN